MTVTVYEWFQPVPALVCEWFASDYNTVFAAAAVNPAVIAAVIGPKGNKGDSGAIGNFDTVEAEISVSGANSIPVSSFVGGLRMLFINGLLQSSDDYSVSGGFLVLPVELGLLPQDQIKFQFSTI